MSSEIAEFNKIVSLLVNKFEKKSRNDVDLANLDRLKRRIQVVKTTLSDDVLCVRALPIFMEYKDKILAREEEFFLRCDARRECRVLGVDVTKDDEFVFALIDAMKNYYVRSHVDEKTFLWDSINRLFELSVKYKILTK
jgi:hypothetical protein